MSKHTDTYARTLRVLSLILAFAMIFSTLGTSGFTVLAEDAFEQTETVAEPEVTAEPAPEAEELAEEISEEPAEEPAEEISEESLEETAEEIAVEEEIPAEDPAEELPEETEEAADPAEEAEAPAELSSAAEEFSEELSEEPAEEQTEELSEEVTEDPAEDAGEDPAEEAAEAPEETVSTDTLVGKAIHAVEEPAPVMVAEAAQQVNEILQAEEPAEPAEPAISYSAQNFRGETDDVFVRVHAPKGVFPEGTKMILTPVSAEVLIDAAQESGEEKTAFAVAVDIIFEDADGDPVQPNGDVRVTLVAKKKLEGESHQAVTMDDEGRVETVGDATATSSQFETDHFTVYGIIGTEYIDEEVEQYIRHKYEFYAGKPGSGGGKKPGEWGWTNVATQIVKDGDTLQFPTDPAGDAKYTFAGWYLTDENGEYAEAAPQVVTIDPATMLKENAKAGDADAVQQVVKVFAKFDTRYKVTFYAGEKGPDDGWIVLKTELVDDGETVSLLDREAAAANGLIPEDGKVLVAWKDAYGNTYRIDGTDGKGAKVTVDGEDIELCSVFEDAHNVTFDLVLTKVFPEKIPDQVVENGKKIEDTSVYTKDQVYKFYKFGGWYENYDPKGETLDDKFKGDPVDLSAWVLSENDEKDIVLHAKWIPDTVKFTVTPFREAQNAAEYEEIHEDALPFEWEADTEFPIDKILEAFPNEKYSNISQSAIGVCHYSGTGALDDDGTNGILVNGEVLPAVQVMNKEGNVIATYDAKKGTLSGEVDRDSIGSVRVNYNRDRYHLYFLFTDYAADPNNITTLGGYTGSLTMSDALKSQAPKGYADVVLPDDIIVKHAQHLYKVTHLVYKYGYIFDPFMGKLPWYYNRQGMTVSGQAIFDDSNQSFPVKTTQPDGGSVCIQLCTKNTQKKYTYVYCYYEGVSSWDEVKSKNAQPTKTEKKEIVYTCNDKSDRRNSGHTHNFDLGTIGEENYIMVAVTGQAAYKLNGTWYDKSEAVWSGDDVQKITVYSVNGYWDGKSNRTGNNSNAPDTVYIHLIPKIVTVTFKQTKDGKVGGFDVAADSRKDDVKVENILSGTAISEILAGADVPDWQTLADNRGVTYKALEGWKCVQYPDGIPEKMPAKDLTFYKEWETDRFTVTLDYGYDDIIEDKADIAYGSAVPSPDTAKLERDGHTLTGWIFYERVEDEDGNVEKGTPLSDVSFHSIVKQDLYAKAQWVPDMGFAVEYRAGDHGEFDGQETKKDPVIYRGGTAPVNYMPEPKMDYVFVGYKILDKDGGLHDLDNPKTVAYDEDYDLAAGDEKVGKIVLLAQYEKAEYETTVIYHANYPGETGDRKVEYDSYVTNNTFTVADITAVGFQSIYVDADGSRWQFDGWSNKKDAHTSGFDASEDFEYFKPGEKAAAGDPANIKSKGANDLWAVWKVIEEEPEPKTTSVSGTKIWDDNDDAAAARPESITVRLHADGKEIDRKTITAAEDWKYVFSDLLEYDDADNKIEYTVTEDHVPGYTTAIDGYSITNTYHPGETSVEVSKVWEDDHNRDGLRPASVQVRLLAEGVYYGDPVTLSSDNHWSYIWSELPEKDGGKEIAYTVRDHQCRWLYEERKRRYGERLHHHEYPYPDYDGSQRQQGMGR